MTLLEKFNLWPSDYEGTVEEEKLFRLVSDMQCRGTFGVAFEHTDDEDLEDCLNEWFNIIND